MNENQVVADLQRIARDKERLDRLWIDVEIAVLELEFLGSGGE